MSIWVILNLFFAVISLKWAREAFDNKQNALGWIQLVVSAVNAAAFASAVF